MTSQGAGSGVAVLLAVIAGAACGSSAGGTGTSSSASTGGETSSSSGSTDTSSSTGSGGAAASSGSTTGTGATGTGASTSTSTASSTSSSGSAPACHFPTDYANGSVTYYTLGMGSAAVNCSFDVVSQSPDAVAHVPFGGGQYFGAMNTADYDDAAVCGACIEVDRADNGKKVQIMIVDQCPSAGNPACKTGHIDLSEQAFLQIGTAQEGYLGTGNGGAVGKISWKYVPCPEPSGISYRLKDPTNQYWNQILVMGHTTPIAKVEVNISGAWQAGTRQSYNYWQVGSGNLGPAPYHVRVTDVDGASVEAMLNLQAGDQQTSVQLPVCQ